MFKAAAIETGIPAIADFNTGSNFGVSYFDVSQRSGLRLNAYQAFVKPLLGARSNLKVVTAKIVSKLIFDAEDASRCIGVETGDTSVFVEDGGEVILSTGTVGSVQILVRLFKATPVNIRSIEPSI